MSGGKSVMGVGAAATLGLLLSLGGCVANTDSGVGVSNDALTAGSGCYDAAIGAPLRMRDDDSRSVPVPFPINFYGNAYGTLWVNSNGNVTLNGSNPFGSPTTVPNGALALIAPLYGNFNPAARTTADVYYAQAGTAPNRQINVSWVNVPEAGGVDSNTFQLQLHEDGHIIFTYDALGTDGFNPDASAMNAGIASGGGASAVLASGAAIPGFAGTATRFDWNGSDYDAFDGCDAAPPPPPPPSNDPPVADAGADQVLECTGGGSALASLDGSGSSDPNGDALSFEWSEGGDVLASSETADVSLSVGSHEIDLTVDDGEFSDSDSVTIVVQDSSAPSIDMTVETTEVWPPNHRMETVLSGVSASDACCDAELSISVSGDDDDHEIVDNGDGTFDVKVRAERDGWIRGGRTYEITIDAVDCGGNSSSETVEVHVAHDQRGCSRSKSL